jgi:peptidoglycan/xylan/chitin deacetylase (PgdA/CDA1 family)
MATSGRTINICFHGIGTPSRTLEDGEDHYWLAADQFRSIIHEISSWPSVAISFDDGNESDIELGLGELTKHQLDATFFVLAGRIDQPGSLSADQLRQLRHTGMAIGTHGMHHRPWTELDDVARHSELVEARNVIENAIGEKITRAACPLGRYNNTVLRALREYGYQQVNTSDRTTAPSDAWLQPRYSVRSTDTAAFMRASILERQSARFRIRPAVAGFVKRRR